MLRKKDVWAVNGRVAGGCWLGAVPGVGDSGHQRLPPAWHGQGGSWQSVFHPARLRTRLRQRPGKGSVGFFLWFLSCVFLSPPRWDSRAEPGKRLLCVCLSVRLLSILRGRGRWGRGSHGKGGHLRCCGGSRRAGLWWLCFPSPFWPLEFPGLWCPSRNSSRMHPACSMGPNPALSCGVPALCVTLWGQWGQGLVSRDLHLAWQLGVELFLPNPGGKLRARLGRAEVQGEGRTLTPLLPGKRPAAGCRGICR